MSDLAIRQKIEDMMVYAYQAIKQFPKSEKFSLGADIRSTMSSLLKLVIRCNKRYTKKTTMQDLDIELDSLRGLVRVAHELKFIPFNKYANWSRMLDEIGKMIGGWFKSIQYKQKPSTG